jgi:hypothetical protein
MNPIATENQLAGVAQAIWDIPDTGDGTFKYGDPAIQGYAVPFSINLGQTVTFKISLTSTPIPYRIDVYRLGYYGGSGARLVASVNPPAASFSQVQPACMFDVTTNLIDCGKWIASASWTPTAPLISGVYIAKLVRTDIASKGSHIVFVVREDARQSDILAQTSDTTWHAYNAYADAANLANKNSYYGDGSGNKFPNGRAYKVSYNRPFDNRSRPGSLGAEDFLFSDEYPMHRWLEANGYDVTYCAGIDIDAGPLRTNHKIFMSVGHDEYWSAAQRANVETARAGGMHLAFFSGNNCFWKTRWENDASGAKRTQVCYKETYSGAKIDPTNIWTGTWRDPMGAAYDAGKPENALVATLFSVNGIRLDNIQVPAPYRPMRLWRNTPISALPASAPTSFLANYTLGFEWGEDLDDGFRPPWALDLSSATYQLTNQHLQDPTPGQNNGDPGTNFTSGPATHSLMLYKYRSSGALVFGAGTTRWSWGLDATHDAGDVTGAAPTTDQNIQQATVNLLADMGVTPATLQGGGLTPASPSNDTTPPVTVITFPLDGGSVAAGANVAIAGTAADAAGIVSGVEVSVDSGSSWHPAAPANFGLENWVYNWTPTAAGATTIMARSVDDSANQESPGASAAVTIVSPAGSPVSFWSRAPTPTIVTVNDPQAVELGMKFQSSIAGSVVGLAFYKGPQNTGTHVGNLWDSNGTNLATGTFAGETASGWQTMNFPNPVNIPANTTFIISYHTTSGFYSADRNFFTNSLTVGPLVAAGGNLNDVYHYGSGGTVPTNTFQATNYWVDVLFQPSATV